MPRKPLPSADCLASGYRAVMDPLTPATVNEAAAILECSIPSVQRRVLEGRLQRHQKGKHGAFSRAEVDQLAADVYDWRRHVHDPTSYWMTTERRSDPRRRPAAHPPATRARPTAFLGHNDGIRLYRKNRGRRIGPVGSLGRTGTGHGSAEAKVSVKAQRLVVDVVFARQRDQPNSRPLIGRAGQRRS